MIVNMRKKKCFAILVPYIIIKPELTERYDMRVASVLSSYKQVLSWIKTRKKLHISCLQHVNRRHQNHALCLY